MIIDDVLTVHSSPDPLPLIFDSPHSGTHYPEDFNPLCAPETLQSAEDKYVDDLFSAAPDYNACLLSALFPRIYIDANRAADDIDLELLGNCSDITWPENTPPPNPSKRSHAGIGLIWRLLKPGKPLYDRDLTPDEIMARIKTYYTPYHDVLEKLINGAHYRFGQVWHINCHSMPSSKRAPNAQARGRARITPFTAPDIVLGDRNGTTCDIDFTHSLRDFLSEIGYKVAINNPYKGVELVRRYSAPATGRHSIQIEINRALYLNEETFEKTKNYAALKSDITKLIGFCADYTQSNLTQIAAD